MDLTNKQIVITGGTSGIGRALVDQLYTQNQVVVIGRSAEKLEALHRETGVAVYRADLADIKSVRRVAETLSNTYNRLDVLINNAAIQNTPTFLDETFTADTIAPEITLNFTAPCLLVAYLLPKLNHSEQAAIVNINSGLGIVPKTTSAVYCGTKGVLRIFTKSLRHQLEGTNISVQQAYMPLVDTGMTKGRGNGKLTAEAAAAQIVHGILADTEENKIGKTGLLVLLNRLTPSLAVRIMKKA